MKEPEPQETKDQEEEDLLVEEEDLLVGCDYVADYTCGDVVQPSIPSDPDGTCDYLADYTIALVAVISVR
ncbi:hypothetical protein OROHE_005002 [Orobanche hederae]